ncbi:hypothetical protein BO70DRAFT_376930 [Aspergillus heteromorphus CBS 117.55]|uniref:Uncharacterized protein n=1 Tax=Aspergillus heteromorphus CBS 117.55 TaxID=1448321 RepID=A0A317X3R4_9EURO|nr:uncharacterized protein BO70DRAFT_376930 [Aspergillus heteromorphus CBS 117.55]PWY91190.1 hypothetical protein BO70DRAFT_376930 [Aspergillus heteromorphus CBS 117.55]
MSLKRKASFPSLAWSHPAPVFTGRSLMADDAPRHLHSRTRKRFRNDRPDEEVVYENTLRWLYTAQQQQPTPAPPTDEDASEPEPVPSSEIVDPRQQTLHKFFRPSQSTFAQTRSNNASQQTIHTPQLTTAPLQSHNFGLSSPATSAGWGSSSPSSQIDSDMDVDMESVSNEPVQQPRRLVEGFWGT